MIDIITLFVNKHLNMCKKVINDSKGEAYKKKGLIMKMMKVMKYLNLIN